MNNFAIVVIKKLIATNKYRKHIPDDHCRSQSGPWWRIGWKMHPKDQSWWGLQWLIWCRYSMKYNKRVPALEPMASPMVSIEGGSSLLHSKTDRISAIIPIILFLKTFQLHRECRRRRPFWISSTTTWWRNPSRRWAHDLRPEAIWLTSKTPLSLNEIVNNSTGM